MDIDEVKLKRTLLESAILNLVLTFEQQTKTSVEYIRVDKEQLIGRKPQVTYGVSIKLEV